MASKQLPIPAERIEKAILLVRGQKVMLDRDLAVLYGVETRVLNQAVNHEARQECLCLHGAGRCDALKRSTQQEGGPSQYRDHADFCEIAGNTFHA